MTKTITPMTVVADDANPATAEQFHAAMLTVHAGYIADYLRDLATQIEQHANPVRIQYTLDTLDSYAPVAQRIQSDLMGALAHLHIEALTKAAVAADIARARGM